MAELEGGGQSIPNGHQGPPDLPQAPDGHFDGHQIADADAVRRDPLHLQAAHREVRLEMAGADSGDERGGDVEERRRADQHGHDG